VDVIVVYKVDRLTRSLADQAGRDVRRPSSARSETCAWVVEEAVRLGKRILPVLYYVPYGTNPMEKLISRNYTNR